MPPARATAHGETIRAVRSRPETAARTFAAALARKQRSAVEACFSRHACLLTADGTTIRGRGDIGAIIQQLADRNTEIEPDGLIFISAGEIAFSTGSWSIHSDGPERSRYVETHRPVLILHRAEFEWKIAVVAPWGTP